MLLTTPKTYPKQSAIALTEPLERMSGYKIETLSLEWRVAVAETAFGVQTVSAVQPTRERASGDTPTAPHGRREGGEVEPPKRIELLTFSLRVRCSTD